MSLMKQNFDKQVKQFCLTLPNLLSKIMLSLKPDLFLSTIFNHIFVLHLSAGREESCRKCETRSALNILPY